MKEPQKRSRKTMVMGLLILLVPGVIWSAGQLIHASRAQGPCASQANPGPGWVLPQPVVAGLNMIAGLLADEAHAAEPVPPSVVRKKLPAGSPAPGAQAAPAAPPAVAAQAPAPAETAPPPKEPAPTPVATPSVQTPVPPSSAPAVPQRPMVATPKPEAPPGQAPAAPAPAEVAPKPETAAAPAAPPPAPPIVKPFAVSAPNSVAVPKPVVAAPKPVVAAAPAQGRRQTHPYSVLLSSCREPENALAALTQYRRPGYSPYIVRTEVPQKGVWWRTLMGSFKTLQAALAAINQLKLEDAVVVKTPYANLIGEFPSEKDAAQAAERLTGKGLHPYPVNGSANSVLLMVGGFATSQAAESYRQELEAKGVTTQVVRR